MLEGGVGRIHRNYCKTKVCFCGNFYTGKVKVNPESTSDSTRTAPMTGLLFLFFCLLFVGGLCLYHK